MGHEIFAWIAASLACGALFASIYILMFALKGDWPRRSPQIVPAIPPSTRFVILIPAHNESEGIAPALRSVLTASYPAHLLRPIVIADNCTDNTAEVAEAHEIEVWKRTDPDNRGKGQALDWAFERLSDSEFDMAVVLDADSELDPQYLARMDAEYRACEKGHTDIVFQGRYEFMPCDERRHWFEQLTIASKSAENRFIYAPRSSLKLVLLIQGNGFAISRSALAQVPFKASSVVEDAEYAISLALSGVPVRYVGDALVRSRMTARINDAAPQRLRWASGMFLLIWHSVPRLLIGAWKNLDWRLAEAVLMLFVTSRITIIYITLAAIIALAAAHGLHGTIVLTLLLLASLLQAAYAGMVICHAGSARVNVKSLLLAPVYLSLVGLAQMGAALGLKRGQWNRTVR